MSSFSEAHAFEQTEPSAKPHLAEVKQLPAVEKEKIAPEKIVQDIYGSLYKETDAHGTYDILDPDEQLFRGALVKMDDKTLAEVAKKAKQFADYYSPENRNKTLAKLGPQNENLSKVLYKIEGTEQEMNALDLYHERFSSLEKALENLQKMRSSGNFSWSEERRGIEKRIAELQNEREVSEAVAAELNILKDRDQELGELQENAIDQFAPGKFSIKESTTSETPKAVASSFEKTEIVNPVKAELSRLMKEYQEKINSGLSEESLGTLKEKILDLNDELESTNAVKTEESFDDMTPGEIQDRIAKISSSDIDYTPAADETSVRASLLLPLKTALYEKLGVIHDQEIQKELAGLKAKAESLQKPTQKPGNDEDETVSFSAKTVADNDFTRRLKPSKQEPERLEPTVAEETTRVTRPPAVKPAEEVKKWKIVSTPERDAEIALANERMRTANKEINPEFNDASISKMAAEKIKKTEVPTQNIRLERGVGAISPAMEGEIPNVDAKIPINATKSETKFDEEAWFASEPVETEDDVAAIKKYSLLEVTLAHGAPTEYPSNQEVEQMSGIFDSLKKKFAKMKRNGLMPLVRNQLKNLVLASTALMASGEPMEQIQAEKTAAANESTESVATPITTPDTKTREVKFEPVVLSGKREAAPAPKRTEAQVVDEAIVSVFRSPIGPEVRKAVTEKLMVVKPIIEGLYPNTNIESKAAKIAAHLEYIGLDLKQIKNPETFIGDLAQRI